MAIQDLLIAWAKGKALNDAPNGVKTPAFVRLLGKGNVSMPPLDEDTHIVVDKIISDMRHKKPTHYSVIHKYYLEHKQDAEIGREMRPKRMSRSKVREIRLSAEYYIEGRLE